MASLMFQQRTKTSSEDDVSKTTRCSHITNTSKPGKSSISPSTTVHCNICDSGKKAIRKHQYKLLFCLAPAFFVASLDLTIVATALPFIASHFDSFTQLNWIVTAYTLTSTVFIPLFGQFSDTFGRYTGLQLASIISIIGSVLCATAPIWPVLLLGRALQGIGCAGVGNISMIILADSVSLKEQAVNISIFQLINGIAYGIGPVIGGYLTSASWRYTFVLCAATGTISVITVFFLRNDLKPGKVSVSRPANGLSRLQTIFDGLVTLDIGGVVLFILGIGLIILGTAWGGATYPWKSAAVVISLVLGCLLLVLFGIYEYLLEPGRFLSNRHPNVSPILPFDLLCKKDMFLVCVMAASAGAALYSAFYFVSIYFTLAEGYSASRAGIQLLYYMPGLGIGVYSAILLCNKWPGQTFWPLFSGTIVETAGIAALTYAVHSRNHTLVNFMMALAGVGTGVRFMPQNLHLTGMFRDRLAPAYSLLRFALPFGGTLALTIMGSVFQNRMAASFSNLASSIGSDNGTSNHLDLHSEAVLCLISQLSPTEQATVHSAGAEATMWAFIAILPFLALSMVASMGLGNVWILAGTNLSTGDSMAPGDVSLTNTTGDENSSADHVATRGWILDSIYLLTLLRGSVRTERRRPPRADSGERLASTHVTQSARLQCEKPSGRS